LPMGLGDYGNRYNLVYMKAFSQIVLREKKVIEVLEKQAKILHEIVNATRISCWLPDIDTNKPCPVR
jgi:hypothetical protein